VTLVATYFARLGRRIDAAWSSTYFEERAFAEIAADALRGDPPAEQVTLDDVIDWAFRDGRNVPQIAPSRDVFGQPPITVFRGHRFYIEVLLWVDGSTSIHEHGFTGAFTPIQGKSVHSRWSFSEAGRRNSELRWGSVSFDSSEILHPGNVREIHGGPRGAHQLFHLDRPSATVVVRTYGDAVHLPQLSYFPPCLAFAELGNEDPYWNRIHKFLGALRITGDPRYQDYVRRIVLGDDLAECFRCLRHISSVGSASEIAFADGLAREAGERLGPAYDAILCAQPFLRRSMFILRRRRDLEDTTHRFLLAMLMLMQDRDDVLAGFAAWTGTTRPVDDLVLALGGLPGPRTWGVELDDANSSILRAVLSTQSRTEFFAQLARDYGSGQVLEQSRAIEAHAQSLSTSLLLEPLFSRAQWLRVAP
jgi:hypothetical protein